MHLTLSVSELQRTLKNALLYASTNEMRPILNAVQLCVDDDDPTVVRWRATDSYALLEQHIYPVEVTDPTDLRFVLAAADAKQLLAALPKGKLARGLGVHFISGDDGLAVDVDHGATFTFSPVEFGEYPDMDTIIDGFAANELGVIAFASEELVRAGKLVPANMGGRNPVVFDFDTDLKPARFTWGDAESFGLIMPVRYVREQQVAA